MKIQCDYCGTMIDETATSCPHCGAKLSGVNRTSDNQPKTIEELQQWYFDHHLPPEETTRFFIGKDIKEPKAFGIYKTSTGDCVVYKNKSTGERAIRYQGADEAYAVNELYQRLKAEIADQKQANSKTTHPHHTSKEEEERLPYRHRDFYRDVHISRHLRPFHPQRLLQLQRNPILPSKQIVVLLRQRDRRLV